MSVLTAFWTSLGLQAAALVAFLVVDMFGRRAWLTVLASLSLVAAGIVAAAQAWLSDPAFVTNAFVTGSGFSLVAGVVVVLAGLATLADAGNVQEDSARGSLMTFAAMGAYFAAQSADVVAVIIALEISAVSGYALVASRRTPAAHEASVKYLVQGSVATALLVLGVGVLAATGAVGGGYLALNQALSQATQGPLLLGTVLVLSGLAFKAGAAPLHAWAPDAYQVAPPTGGAVLGGVVKAASVAALATAVGAMATGGASADAPLGLIGTQVFPLVGGLALLSMVIGSTVALRQRSYLRLLGYAGVAQVGFALLAVACGRPGAALLAITTYSVAAAGAFVFAAAVQAINPSWDGTVEGLAGTARRSPLLATVAIVVMMSLAGIPPLAGFWGKLEVLRSGVAVAMGLIAQGQVALGSWYALVTTVAVVSTMVSIAYYGGVVRAVFEEPIDPATDGHDVRAPLFVSAVLGASIVAFGVIAMVLPYQTVFSGFGL